jgi:ribose transport system ATP-binding protein
LRGARVGVIYISHFLEEVREIADRYTVLRDGRVAGGGEIARASDESLVAQMVGRSVENLFARREAKIARDAETILEVRDLCAPPLLKRASFDLRRGEILGVAGLLGSGRTHLVRALFGLERVESGTITVRGKAITTRTSAPASRLAQRLGYLSEDRKGEGLALALSVADNVTLTRLSTCSRRGWLDLARQRAQAETQTRALGVRARTVRQPVATLSGGNQQKVALARLLHQDADILLLDEPTRGIDIGSKAQVYATIARCAAEGRAILFVSSYLPELFGVCDRLAVMSRGRLSPARAVSEWTPESVMRAAIGADDDVAPVEA